MSKRWSSKNLDETNRHEMEIELLKMNLEATQKELSASKEVLKQILEDRNCIVELLVRGESSRQREFDRVAKNIEEMLNKPKVKKLMK